MIRLILIRHAKSSWAVPGQLDIERPLNARGRRGADAIGRWLKREGLRPEHALVSLAARTRETWERVTAETGPVPATLSAKLYEAGPETMLAVLRAAPAASPLALVGHNPTIGEVAQRLLAAAPPDSADFAKYPTGASTVIDFDAERWPEVGWRSGHLAAFVTPRGLDGG